MEEEGKEADVVWKKGLYDRNHSFCNHTARQKAYHPQVHL